MYDTSNNPTHAIAQLHIKGAPTVLTKIGGIVTYNVKYSYCTLAPLVVDISGLSNLVFNLSVGR
jgi:hypothetical protein